MISVMWEVTSTILLHQCVDIVPYVHQLKLWTFLNNKKKSNAYQISVKLLAYHYYRGHAYADQTLLFKFAVRTKL